MNINGLMGNEVLTQTVAQAVEEVKMQPANSELRMQLFKLYCLRADWDRALRQLDILAEISEENARQCDFYKNLILSERLRDLVLAGERQAGNLGEELPEWCAQLQQVNALYHVGDSAAGELLRQQMLAQASVLAGKSAALGEFEWIADGDDRLGPVCEFISAGGYRWVPFADIEQLSVEQPASITDLIWAPTTLVVQGKTYKGFIPARYPVSRESDSADLLGQHTAWQGSQNSRYVGIGRKMWVSSNGECSLFEAGEIGR